MFTVLALQEEEREAHQLKLQVMAGLSSSKSPRLASVKQAPQRRPPSDGGGRSRLQIWGAQTSSHLRLAERAILLLFR